MDETQQPPKQKRISYTVERTLAPPDALAIARVTPGEETTVVPDASDAFEYLASSTLWDNRPFYTPVCIVKDTALIVRYVHHGVDDILADDSCPRTFIHRQHYKGAMYELEGEEPEFDLLFDSHGYVAFRGEQRTVLAAPTLPAGISRV